jgi:hypothetical protein
MVAILFLISKIDLFTVIFWTCAETLPEGKTARFHCKVLFTLATLIAREFKQVKLEFTENPDVERTSEGNLTCQTEVSPVSVIHQ